MLKETRSRGHIYIYTYIHTYIYIWTSQLLDPIDPVGRFGENCIRKTSQLLKICKLRHQYKKNNNKNKSVFSVFVFIVILLVKDIFVGVVLQFKKKNIKENQYFILKNLNNIFLYAYFLVIT